MHTINYTRSYKYTTSVVINNNSPNFLKKLYKSIEAKLTNSKNVNNKFMTVKELKNNKICQITNAIEGSTPMM